MYPKRNQAQQNGLRSEFIEHEDWCRMQNKSQAEIEQGMFIQAQKQADPRGLLSTNLDNISEQARRIKDLEFFNKELREDNKKLLHQICMRHLSEPVTFTIPKDSIMQEQSNEILRLKESNKQMVELLKDVVHVGFEVEFGDNTKQVIVLEKVKRFLEENNGK